MQDMTIAITGATGFLGGRTMELALEQGYAVRALTRRTQEDRKNLAWVKGALSDQAALDALCHGADTVLHIAGVVNAPTPALFDAGNIKGTANMLSAAQKAGDPHFIHVSSLAARQPELSDYGRSKAGGETLVTRSVLPWSVIRPPGIYGPGDTEFLDMFRLAQKGLALLPPKGRVSLIHVDDMALLLLAMIGHGPARTIWEADDGIGNDTLRGWDHRDFARAVGHAVGRDKLLTLNAPAALLKTAARADRMVRGSAAKLTPDRARYLSWPDWTVEPSRRPPASLWSPAIDTQQGLEDTVSWYRAQGWLN
ncbi:NAD-dependent epimerase/dehydratase family protein [Parasphingorhabdus sp. DH2-15]|uniref:NAD-dependent epimerase/dehydratase family protein n=1 Tax=Parasphingorhabdus sp. DH2-15 TaxID=3444112 RepID=UPI003F684692